MIEYAIYAIVAITTALITFTFIVITYMTVRLLIKFGAFDFTKPNCDWNGENPDYKTSCGESFYDSSERGDPITDSLNYCPHCGRKIKLKGDAPQDDSEPYKPDHITY